MKKILLIIHCAFLILTVTAQREYWGMTVVGGKYFNSSFTSGSGVIFKVDKMGKNYKKMYDFDSATGIEPWSSLIQAKNGKMYGFTGRSTSNQPTILFEFNPYTQVYKVLMRADTLRNGRLLDVGAPFQASNGKIYSVASDLLVETDPETFTNTVIGSRLDAGGGENYFMEASNGKVYFMTANYIGIVGQRGALYELNLQNKNVTKRYQFVDGTGSPSYGVPVEYSPGILYGTFSGGSGPITSKGGIFSFNLNTSTYTQKQLFYNVGLSSAGSMALAGLTKFGNKLYGATYAGGRDDKGVIYKYDPVTNALDTLINFATVNWTTFPYDSFRQEYYTHNFGWGTELISAYDNRLWGVTVSSIFAFDPVAEQFESVASLQVGSTDSVNKLGYYTSHLRLLQTCFKPYFYFTIPDTLHVFQGQPVSFGLGTPNTDTFLWYKDNVYLPTQTDSLLHITAAALSDQGWYHTKLTNECGDSTTKKFYLKVDIITPLELVFTGRVQGTNALLQWTDPASKDAEIYTLQRSPDGRNFATLYTTKAKPSQQAYNYTDEAFKTFANANNGKAFYRLLQQNKDGKENYSSMVLLTTANSQLTITPNPASDKIIVGFGKLMDGVVNFDLIAANGQIVLSKQIKNIATQPIAINHLPAGVYTMQITTNEGVENRKVIIER
jgi:uncharacterized repeat protein (TIGR03803 family)